MFLNERTRRSRRRFGRRLAAALAFAPAFFAVGCGEPYGGECGDGHLDLHEVCDDGNVASGDGCSADCSSDESCGNFVVDAASGEECDDGNELSGDGCQPTCTLPICGDGYTDATERCDGEYNCSADCKTLDMTCLTIRNNDPTAPDGVYSSFGTTRLYCDFTDGVYYHASKHAWGPWGDNLTIVVSDRGAPETGSLANWESACALFGKTKYPSEFAENNIAAYTESGLTYADASDYWTTVATQIFPSISYDSVLILQDSVNVEHDGTLNCWAHNIEPNALQAFGAPAGPGTRAYCGLTVETSGQFVQKRYHIYLCVDP